MSKLRVYFSGMCMNVVHGANQAKTSAKSLDVLMLSGITKSGGGFRHYPSLTVRQAHIAAGAAVDGVVTTRSDSDDAQYWSVVDLLYFDCRLKITPHAHAGVSLDPTPLAANGAPKTDADWRSLALVSDPAKAANALLKVMPSALPSSPDRHQLVQSTFHLASGTLAAAKPSAFNKAHKWTFYKGQPSQAFADTTVVTIDVPDEATVVLQGTGFGDKSGRQFEVGLDTSAGDIAITVVNVPIRQLAKGDDDDFQPFLDILTPATKVAPHQHEAQGEPVYCMVAINFD
jgi:hypothetical protein